MLVKFDCYDCILSQIVRIARDMSSDDSVRHDMMRKFLSAIEKNVCRFTPPEMAAEFYDICRRMFPDKDHFREEKLKSTELAVKIYPELKKIVNASTDPFAAALKLAIGGNIIDFGVNPDFDLGNADGAIREVINMPVDENAAAELKKRIDAAGKILYIMDNCGEAVIDRLLLEQLSGKVTIAVRGLPILNDITRAEIIPSGLGDFPAVDTGDGTPGVSPRRSPEFIEVMRSADLIIAKGQGNFESLEGNFSDKPLFFLFRAKCPVVQKYLNVAPGSMQIIGKNLF